MKLFFKRAIPLFILTCAFAIHPVTTWAITYCGPANLAAGTGRANLDSVKAVSAAYPAPANLGYLGDLKISHIHLNGVAMVKIIFHFNPYATPATDDPYFKTLQMRTLVGIAFPEQNSRHDILAISANMGTVNGIPPNGSNDPLHPASEMANWWHGTDISANFQQTMASVTSSYHVPIGFYDPVPNTLEFQPSVQAAITQVRQIETTDLCDDHRCDGQLTKDGDIHTCLNGAGFIDSVVSPPSNGSRLESINIHPTVIYAIAMSRFVDVAQMVMNQYRTMHTSDQTPYDFQSVVGSGGSKRGVASQAFLLEDPRAKAAWSGHSNMSNFLATYAARDRIWDHTYYFSGLDVISFLSGRQDWLNRYDRAYFNPSIWAGKTVFITSGLRDTYFDTGAELQYSNALPADTDYLIQPNYPHGGGSYAHMVIWRNIVAHVANGSPLMMVNAAWDVNHNHVYAQVNNVSPDRVELWCSTGPSNTPVISLRHTDYPDCAEVGRNYTSPPPDNRYDNWTKVSMHFSHGRYSATPPAAPGDYGRWQSCVVHAFKGGQDPYEATSETMHNAELCSLNGLPIVSSSSLDGVLDKKK